MALVAFLAIVVAAFGLISLFTDTDVIAAPGLGPLPGVVGVALAMVALAAVLGPTLRAERPSFLTSLWAAIACYLAYLAGVGTTTLIVAGDIAVAASVVGALAIGWQAPVVALAAAVCAWGGIALRRTHARRPRWPWEDPDDE